ncbi:DNA polymerase IV [bacterium]|nr:DNA polymerase IV [bacterium]
MTINPSRILHVDMDAFFASCEIVKNPILNGKPVIVGGSAEARGVVSAASYEARKFGVHSAMPMAQAKKLCPQGVFITSNFADYSRFSKKIIEIFYLFTPEVIPMSLDEAYLDITASQKLFGNALNIADQIKRLIKGKTDLDASIGIASSRIAAKFASTAAKPNGIVMILPGYEKTFLAPFPVGKICGIGEKTTQQLDKVGIKTVDDLARADIKSLILIFGKSMGETLKKYSHGLDPTHFISQSEEKSISKETTFPEDIYKIEYISSKLNFLAEKVTFNLRRKGFKASTITLKIRYSDFSTHTNRKTLNASSDRDDIILDVCKELLKKNLKKKKVRLIGVSLSNLTKGIQIDLFNGNRGEKKRDLYKSMDSIREKFGFESILSANTLLSKK